jgi:hypothetical protein
MDNKMSKHLQEWLDPTNTPCLLLAFGYNVLPSSVLEDVLNVSILKQLTLDNSQ